MSAGCRRQPVLSALLWESHTRGDSTRRGMHTPIVQSGARWHEAVRSIVIAAAPWRRHPYDRHTDARATHRE